MKRLFLLFVLCCLTIGSMFPQEIDPMLGRTIEDNRMHMRDVREGRIRPTRPQTTILKDKDGKEVVLDNRHVVNGIDTMVMKERINLRYSPTGAISWISVIGRLKDGNACPEDELMKVGVKVTCQVGPIVCMSVPAEAWDALAKMDVFERLEADYANHLDNDCTRLVTGAAYVTGETSGAALPETKFTGKGVVVGVIDTGIDFNHASFRDPVTGDTRIKEALIYGKDSQSPTIYTDQAEIEALECGTPKQTHGSHTSATAAGSNIPGLDCRGMAPEADLVLCDLAVFYNSCLINSANEIFHYADEVNKPAVINLSLGGHEFPYNAKGQVQKAYGILTENGDKAGRIVCFSAGNEASDKIGLRAKIKDGGVKTAVHTYLTNKTTDYPLFQNTDIYIYNVGGSPFTVTLKAIDFTTGVTKDLSELTYSANDSLKISITQSYSSGNANHDGLNYNYLNISLPNFYVYDADCMLSIEVKGTDGDEIRFVDEIGGKYMYFCGEEDYRTLRGYASSHGEMSINSLACTDAVLSVGAWCGNDYFHSIDGYYYSNDNMPLDQIAYFSSFGLDDHDIARPDILAPGVWLNSALNLYCPDYFTNKQLDSQLREYSEITGWMEVTIGEKYKRYCGVGAMSGTSMACPTATGIVALWLQANPDLTVKQIRAMLADNALNDKYTTDTTLIPSGNVIQAGKGKIDALRGIKQILGTDNYPMDVAVTISDARLATYSSEYPLNFASVYAPKAYTAGAYNGDVVTFQRREGMLAANTGLLLNAAPGTYRIPIAAEGTTPKANMLYGTATGTVTFTKAAEVYVLAKPVGQQVGFYPNAAGLQLAKGKAYLKLDEGTPAVKEMAMVFRDDVLDPHGDDADVIFIDSDIDHFYVIDDNVTGISEISDSSVPANGSEFVGYSLSGQRLSHLQKGINIVNGKKYIIL